MENLSSKPEKHSYHYNKKESYRGVCKGGIIGAGKKPDTKNSVKNMISRKDRHVAINKADRKGCIPGSGKTPGIKKSVKRITQRNNRRGVIIKAGRKDGVAGFDEEGHHFVMAGAGRKPNLEQSVKGAIPQNVRPVARPSPPEAPPPPDALEQ